jgi:hypothetical protein
MLALFIFILVTLISCTFGIRVLKMVRVPLEPYGMRAGFAIGLSLATLTICLFILGLCKLYYPVTAWLILVLMAVIGLPEIRGLLKAMRWRNWGWQTRLERCLGLLIAIFILLGLISAMAPPTGMDTGAYHFTIPKIFCTEHGLVSREDVPVHKTGGYYMIYVFGMLLEGEILAKLLNLLCFLTTAIFLFSWARTTLGALQGWVACFVAITTPLFVGFMGYAYLEGPITLYVTLSLGAMALYIQNREIGWFYLTPLFAGLAISTKITAFPLVVIWMVTLVSAFRDLRGPRPSKVILRWLDSLLIMICFGGFWLLWNRWTTGHFLYPYSGTFARHGWELLPPPTLRVTLGFLKNLFTYGTYWTESLGPFLWMAFLIYIFRVVRRPGVDLYFWTFLGIGVVFIVGLSIAGPGLLKAKSSVRYLIPLLLPCGCMLASEVYRGVSEMGRMWRVWMAVLLLVPGFVLLGLKIGKTVVAAPAALGIESRDEYLSKKIETYSLCQYVNEKLPGAKVLFMGLRPYYLDCPFIYVTPMARRPFYHGLKTPQGFLARMREHGITHVIYEPTGRRLPAWIGKIIGDIEDFFSRDCFKELARRDAPGGVARLYAFR